MKPGDIYLADFKESVAVDNKLRPVLIVSADSFNRGEDIVVLPISHSADPTEPHVHALDTKAPEFRLTGLNAEPSSIKWTKPFTLPKTLLKRRLGHVSRTTLDVVRDKLKTVISWPTPAQPPATPRQ
jgi:mRNA-degrading endonuclease toxin of MazEF toxin-antitoxin module